MITNVIKENVLRIVLMLGLIIGMQIPNFIFQYELRIDAHLKEAEINFSGFQQTANTFYNGDINALIEKHKQSTDSVFKSEAKIIESIYNRIVSFKEELKALDQSIFKKIIHVIFKSNFEIISETYNSYIPTVPLTLDALFCGVILGYILIGFIQLLLKVLKRKFLKKRKQLFQKN